MAATVARESRRASVWERRNPEKPPGRTLTGLWVQRPRSAIPAGSWLAHAPTLASGPGERPSLAEIAADQGPVVGAANYPLGRAPCNHDECSYTEPPPSSYFLSPPQGPHSLQHIRFRLFRRFLSFKHTPVTPSWTIALFAELTSARFLCSINIRQISTPVVHLSTGNCPSLAIYRLRKEQGISHRQHDEAYCRFPRRSRRRRCCQRTRPPPRSSPVWLW